MNERSFDLRSIITLNDNGNNRIDRNVEPAAPSILLDGSCRTERLLETRFYSAKITAMEKFRAYLLGRSLVMVRWGPSETGPMPQSSHRAGGNPVWQAKALSTAESTRRRLSFAGA